MCHTVREQLHNLHWHLFDEFVGRMHLFTPTFGKNENIHCNSIYAFFTQSHRTFFKISLLRNDETRSGLPFVVHIRLAKAQLVGDVIPTHGIKDYSNREGNLTSTA